MPKKTLFVLLLVCTFPLLLSFSCNMNPASASTAAGGSESKLCIASWNVQNIFDEIENGTEYDEYKASSGWDKSAFEIRLSNAAQVLEYLPKASDYLIVLNEVENPNVVEALLSEKKLKAKGLAWYAFASFEKASIGSAVISSIPIIGAKVHATDDGLRPVLEVEFETNGGKLYLLCVHFKSNLGGETETAPLRLKASQVVTQVASELKKNNPGCLILVCGDFNEECWDNNAMVKISQQATTASTTTAQPITPTALTAALKVSGAFSNGLWYCPWLDNTQNLWPNGSYYYNDDWKCYDNILISQEGKDGTGLEFSKAGVIFEGIIRTSDDKPNAWQRQLLKGVSDHLPVWVLLN